MSSSQNHVAEGYRGSDQMEGAPQRPWPSNWEYAASSWQRRIPCSDVMRKAAHVIVAALLVLITGLGQAAIAESKGQTGDPAVFIQNLADRAIQVLSASNGSLREREDGFRDILRNDVAMGKIGRFVVGDYWRKMKPSQRKTYQNLFSEWLLKTYSVRLGGYSRENFRIVGTSKAGKRDVIVHTRIGKSAGDGFNADWRVRQIKGRYKIIDIYVEGVSMAVTLRTEFDAVLRKRGIDGLIDMIRYRLTQLSLDSRYDHSRARKGA